jgi:hypothetical protein
VLTFTSSETRDDGRFTRQFLRCTSDISATVDCVFFLGGISSLHYGMATVYCLSARKGNAFCNSS